MRGIHFARAWAALALAGGSAAGAMADGQAAVDGCIDRLREVGGPDAQGGGEILSREWSQAGPLVRLRDAGGSIWECIGYDDGAVGDLRVVDAMDDGGDAMDGATAASGGPITVRFAHGASSATYDGALGAGEAVQYMLGAKDGQFLTVEVFPDGPEMDYQIINPDELRLLDMIGSGRPYEGQLWQTGDHVVEIVNRSKGPESYRVEFAIR